MKKESKTVSSIVASAITLASVYFALTSLSVTFGTVKSSKLSCSMQVSSRSSIGILVIRCLERVSKQNPLSRRIASEKTFM